MADLVDSKVVGKTELLTTNFDQILDRLFIATKTSTETDFAKSIGISRQAIGKARDRNRLPASWIVSVAEQQKVSSDWLIYGTGPMRRGEVQAGITAECLDLEEYFLVPLLESRVTAGTNGSVMWDEVADYLPFKRFWIEKLVGKSEERKGALLLVRVRGDSMSPTIDQGEVTLVDTHESERINIQDGKIYMVVEPAGGASLKRLVLKADESGKPKLVCLSDNQNVYNKTFTVTIEPGETLKNHVIGRVRWAGKEFE